MTQVMATASQDGKICTILTATFGIQKDSQISHSQEPVKIIPREKETIRLHQGFDT